MSECKKTSPKILNGLISILPKKPENYYNTSKKNLPDDL